jgi:WD40 repeat protein
VNSEIYKIGVDGKNLTRLTNDPAEDYTPAWSPDGTRIAFVSRRDGFTNLYVMDTDGNNVTQLTKHKSTIEVPTWSPDSKLIAFAADFEKSRDIYVISADGSSMDRLTTSDNEEFYPAWSPKLPFLTTQVTEPTAVPDAVCTNSTDPTYGFSLDNPIRIGYDPRDQGSSGAGCMPWLLGPKGQELEIKKIDEIPVGDVSYCKVAVTYEGLDGTVTLYFDTHSFEQPKAPVGFSCGSSVEYLKAITAARY